jgi:phosphinothricin acetyltransferase
MDALYSHVSLRDAEHADLPTIVDIFNASVASRSANAELQPVKVSDREAWFAAHSPDKYPLWVAENDQQIVGWIGLLPFLPRPAYHITAELSIYLAPAMQGRGLGTWMLGELLAACPRLGIANVVSLVFAHNTASLRMNEKLGFERWGYLPAVTELDGVRRDVVILGRAIAPTQAAQ